ncbi:hypothetical protein AVEN_136052-1 [Araneus ventricosus]|uniref:Uncharacterized protein n=1 Tax=Araneus ventricosus TaxID=182803 RepID=A0A4Y2QJ66_ARAVE|nr:hypothetical protein AVEN_136052-1 [Araneus ventricosus]
MSDSQYFVLPVSSILLSWPRCAIVGQSASFFFSFNNSLFTFPNCPPRLLAASPMGSSLSHRHRKEKQGEQQNSNFKYQLKTEAS